MKFPQESHRLEYDADRSVDGLMTGLLPKLRPVLTFDQLRVSRRDWFTEVYLTVFRRQAKRLFHLKLLRRGGKWIVRMGGGDPAHVLAAIGVCRDHFDDWFGVTDAANNNPLQPTETQSGHALPNPSASNANVSP